MKIIVTGATGFIGHALVQALLARGDSVVALTRDVDKGRKLLGPQVEVLEWQLGQPGPWREAFNAADGVVNLAGAPTLPRRWTAGQKARIRNSRVDGTRAVVEAIREAAPRPSVLVNASAIGYYGSQGEAILAEESPPGSDFLARVCQEWEAAAGPVEEMGVRLVLLRTGIVLGRGGGVLPQLSLPFKLFVGGTMGAVGQWVSWIHLEDEVGIIVHALTHDGVRGPIDVTAPNPVTMEVLSRQIGQALHRPTWVPLLDVGMKVALGEAAEAVLASQRVLPVAIEQAGYRFHYTDSGEAVRSLLSS